MTLSITKLTFNALNPIKRFTLDKNTSKSGTDPDIFRKKHLTTASLYFILAPATGAMSSSAFEKCSQRHTEPTPIYSFGILGEDEVDCVILRSLFTETSLFAPGGDTLQERSN